MMMISPQVMLPPLISHSLSPLTHLLTTPSHFLVHSLRHSILAFPLLTFLLKLILLRFSEVH